MFRVMKSAEIFVVNCFNGIVQICFDGDPSVFKIPSIYIAANE